VKLWYNLYCKKHYKDDLTIFLGKHQLVTEFYFWISWKFIWQYEFWVTEVLLLCNMIVVKISSGYQEELNSIKTTIHILYFSRERVRESERAYLSMSQIFASRLKKKRTQSATSWDRNVSHKRISFVLSESDDRCSRVSAYNNKLFEFAWRRKHAIYKRQVAVETESKLHLHLARASVCTATWQTLETIHKSWPQISYLRAEISGTVNPFIRGQIKYNTVFCSASTYPTVRAGGDEHAD